MKFLAAERPASAAGKLSRRVCANLRCACFREAVDVTMLEFCQKGCKKIKAAPT